MKRLLLWNNRIGYVGFSDKDFNELDLSVDTDHILIIFVFQVLNSYLLHINSPLIYDGGHCGLLSHT